MKDGIKLIFLISQPRSGSTLLQSLLSNNESVATASEPWLLLPFLSYNQPHLQNGIYNSKLSTVGINEFFSKAKISHKVPAYLRDFLISIYASLASDNTKYILDKTPRYYEILNLLPKYFPDAKIIVLKRNPLSVLKSILETWDVNDFPELSQYSRDILAAPYILDNFAKENVDNPNSKVIFYEKLVANPKEETKKLYDWLGVEFNDSVLDYKSNKKMDGSMGDKKGFFDFSKIENNINDEIPQSAFWESFFAGYMNYLTPEFLLKYGNYKVLNSVRETNSFNDFLFLNSINYYENNNLTFRDLLKLLKIKVKSKFLKHYNY